MTGFRAFLCCTLLAWPFGAGAHPHIFVDTGVELILDTQGRATGVEVRWTYDELYSLLILEDMELDGDYDGKLTPEELTKLAGFDMQWVEGYEGDLFATGPDGRLALGAPQPLETSLADGKITTRHRRDFAGPVGQVALRAYDPTFYTAYDLPQGVQAEGCTVTRQVADLDAAYALVDRKMTEKAYAEDEYPEVGDAFADTFEVTCPAQ